MGWRSEVVFAVVCIALFSVALGYSVDVGNGSFSNLTSVVSLPLDASLATPGPASELSVPGSNASDPDSENEFSGSSVSPSSAPESSAPLPADEPEDEPANPDGSIEQGSSPTSSVSLSTIPLFGQAAEEIGGRVDANVSLPVAST